MTPPPRNKAVCSHCGGTLDAWERKYAGSHRSPMTCIETLKAIVSAAQHPPQSPGHESTASTVCANCEAGSHCRQIECPCGCWERVRWGP